MVTMSAPSVRNQCLAASVVMILSSGYGLICGWASPSIILLTSDDSPLPSGKITMEAASWIAALLALGALLGNVFYGCIIRTFGRKLPLLSISIPMTISWLLVLFSQNIYYLYAARLLHGFVAGGVVVVAPVFLIEISSDRIRGALSSTVLLSSHAGIMFAFILGNFCNFYTIPIIVIALTIVFTISFSFFPESPTYLMKQNQISKAEKSTRFYQNIRSQSSELLQIEMKILENTVNEKKTKNDNENVNKWSELLSRRGRKAMTIGLVVSALNQLSGCVAMLSYTATIFKEAGSALSPNESAIIVGTIQFIGTCALVFFVDRAGRKFLYILSTIGTASGLITLGVYMLMKSWQWNVETYNWIPIASFSFVLFTASLAILTLPFTVIGEIMPEAIKEFGVTFCNTFISICAFLTMKFLPFLNESLGFHGSMFLFAGFCLFSALFIILYMPETKARSYQQIMNSLQ